MKELPKMPRHATASTIGTIVSIQVIPRDPENKDMLKTDDMIKHVGVLEAFVWSDGQFDFKLKGLELEVIDTDAEVVEIYPLHLYPDTTVVKVPEK